MVLAQTGVRRGGTPLCEQAALVLCPGRVQSPRGSGEGRDAVLAPDAGKPKGLARKLLSLFGLCFVCSAARQEPSWTLSPSLGGWQWAALGLGLILSQPSCCKPQITHAEPPAFLGFKPCQQRLALESHDPYWCFPGY